MLPSTARLPNYFLHKYAATIQYSMFSSITLPCLSSSFSASAMSADLHLLQDFPKIHLPVPSPESSPAGNSSDAADDAPSTSNAAVPAKGKEDSDEELCRTPRSEKYKIPAVLICPPAPRKPRRLPSCKRKLTELKFFEILNREEVDEFFRASFELSEILQSKKRNCC